MNPVKNLNLLQPLFFLFFMACCFFFMVPCQASQQYLVDEGDVLSITVYGHDDLTTTVRISGQGAITYPLLNQVEVAGLTTPEISRKLSLALADGYIINPQVNVFVKEYRVQSIFVSGEVGRAGAYQYEPNMTLIKVISLAGGFKSSASKNQVTISRTIKGQGHVIHNAQNDEAIEPGDVVEVPERLLQEIFVTGQVDQPGICRFEQGLTVIKAITLSGGFTDIANKNKIRITRKTDSTTVIVENVKLNALLQAGDVIIVPESFF